MSDVKDGIILVDKPAGWTSFDVCAKLRGKIRADYRSRGEKPTKRQQRVGHAGTLDPFATGLLVILIGDATKRAGEFLAQDKVYEATFRLGEVSSTGDPEGEITPYRPSQTDGAIPNSRLKNISRADIEETLQGFIGKIEQTPPQYSAIRVGGQRAYKLARRGHKVDMPKRQVTIYRLELMGYSYPELKLRARVSSGTYIRSLAEAIGEKLGTGAYCQELRRTQIGRYKIGQATDIITLTNQS